MSKPEIRTFENADRTAWAMATRLEDLARTKAIERKPLFVALSGGSAPKPFYELLGGAVFAGRVRWSDVQVFQVDERCVPPDDPQSNYRMIHETFLETSPLPKQNFHRMQGERPDRAQAAWEYAELMSRVLRPAPGQFPQFDLVLLGLGTNGHTASLFPGTPVLEEREAWVAPTYVPEIDAFRLTLTYPVLNAARHVIFLVTGMDKAEIVHQVLEGPSGKFPAQGIQPAHGSLEWFLDRGAASMLNRHLTAQQQQ